MGTVERTLPYPEPALTDGVVTLRRWEHRDIECIRRAATDERIPRSTTLPAVYSPDGAIAFVERQWGRQTNGEGLSLAIEDGTATEAVGSIVALFRPQAAVVGIGYWLVPAARGHRCAGRAVTLLTTWLFEHTPTARIEALVVPDNTASRRTLERCGFQEEGLLRSYLDGTDDALMCSLLPADLEPS